MREARWSPEPRKYLAFQLKSATVPHPPRVFELELLYTGLAVQELYMDQLVLNSERSPYPCFLKWN